MRKGIGLLTLLVLLPGVAWADDLYVDCTGGPLFPGVYPNINAALSDAAFDPHRWYNIYITGTCVEKITLVDQARISFIGQDDNASVESPAPPYRGPVFTIISSRLINIQRLNIRNGTQGLRVQTQSSVFVDNCTIEGNFNGGINIGPDAYLSIGSDPAGPARGVVIGPNNGPGIISSSSIVEVAGHTTIQSNTGAAINLTGGRLWMRAVNTENLIQNNGQVGVALSDGVSGSFQGQNRILNNGFTGLTMAGSAASISEVVRASDGAVRAATIEGHQTAGITVARAATINIGGRHMIRNNGFSCSSSPCGGVRVFEGVVQLGGGVEVSGNNSAGVVAELHGSVVIVTPVTVTGNTEGDILLTLLSGAKILYPGVTGNVIGSVTCDDTSVLAGELTGISTISCKTVAGTKKK